MAAMASNRIFLIQLELCRFSHDSKSCGLTLSTYARTRFVVWCGDIQSRTPSSSKIDMDVVDDTSTRSASTVTFWAPLQCGWLVPLVVKPFYDGWPAALLSGSPQWVKGVTPTFFFFLLSFFLFLASSSSFFGDSLVLYTRNKIALSPSCLMDQFMLGLKRKK